MYSKKNKTDLNRFGHKSHVIFACMFVCKQAIATIFHYTIVIKHAIVFEKTVYFNTSLRFQYMRQIRWYTYGGFGVESDTNSIQKLPPPSTCWVSLREFMLGRGIIEALRMMEEWWRNFLSKTFRYHPTEPPWWCHVNDGKSTPAFKLGLTAGRADLESKLDCCNRTESISERRHQFNTPTVYLHSKLEWGCRSVTVFWKTGLMSVRTSPHGRMIGTTCMWRAWKISNCQVAGKHLRADRYRLQYVFSSFHFAVTLHVVFFNFYFGTRSLRRKWKWSERNGSCSRSRSHRSGVASPVECQMCCGVGSWWPPRHLSNCWGESSNQCVCTYYDYVEYTLYSCWS